MVVNLKGPGTLVKGALKPITVSRVRLTFTDGTLSEYEHRIDGVSLSDLSDPALEARHQAALADSDSISGFTRSIS